MMSYPVVSQQPFAMLPLGDGPARVQCPKCGTTANSHTSYERGIVTYLSSMAIGAAGGSLCCLCLVPCFNEDFHDVVHRCPTCKTYLGTYKR